MIVLDTIVNIIVLVLSLSVLICLHELGHLLMAKKFNVFCAEYSIGMGPLIYKRKKEGQETQFSIRALPIGGYVAMAGEGSEEIEDFKDVPKERFLTSIARWKRALIMVAGVTVNFLLAIVLFFASGLMSPILDNSYRSLQVVESSEEVTYLAYEAGLTSNDNIKHVEFVIENNGKTLPVNFDIEDGRDLYYALNLFALEDSPYYNSEFSSPSSENDKWKFTLTTDTNKKVEFTLAASEVQNKKVSGTEIVYVWNMNELGVAFNTRGRTFTEGVDRATDQFVTSLTSFKVLFEPGGWENLGGIISVYTVSSMATDVGFYYYLYVWGYISLNLAIVNLLPFPGLDGWHLVVCAFEGITRRDMPSKVRDIMSVIGTILLFGLMIFVTVLDIIRL